MKTITFNRLILLFVLTLFFNLKCNAQYFLTNEDVEVKNGIITSCSYSFNNKDIFIPEVLDGQTITGIEDEIFSQKKIVRVTLPPTIEYIGANAFSHNYIEQIILPENLRFIGFKAFYDNIIETITIPSQVTTIMDGAFKSLSNTLTSVIFQNESHIAWFAKGAFDSSIRTITLPTHANPEFTKYYNGNVYFEPGDEISMVATFTYVRTDIPYELKSHDVELTEGVITNCKNPLKYTKVIIPETINGEVVTKIGSKSFMGLRVNEIIFPSTLESIGDSAFYNNSFSTLTIPGNVNEIGNYAFYDSYIPNLNLDDGINRIGDWAFRSCRISELTLPGSITHIGENAFAYNDLTGVFIPSNVSIIGNGAFMYNDISALHISQGVSLIGNEVFKENSLTSVHIPSSVSSIGEKAFWKNNLSTLVLSEGTREIKKEAFRYNKITSLVVPSSVTVISQGAFYDNIISNLSLSEGVSVIESNAFRNNRLETIELPSSIRIIEAYAFYFNAYFLNHVSFKADSSLETLYHSNFNTLGSTKSIILPTHSNSEFIDYSDANGNTFQPGETINDFTKTYSANINTVKPDEPYVLTTADVVVEDGIIISYQPSEDHLYIEIPEFIDGQMIKGIGERAFHTKNLMWVNLPPSLKDIGFYAFYGNEISSLILPSSVKTIAERAFSKNNLSQVVIEQNSQLYHIGIRAFYENPNLNNLTLPTLANTEHNSFYNLSGTSFATGELITNFNNTYYTDYYHTLEADEVVLSEGIITASSFNEMHKSISIPETIDGAKVKGIADGVFESKQLLRVKFPDDLEVIGKDAFKFNDLLSISIPANIYCVGENAFWGNDIEQVEFLQPSNIRYIGASAFEGNELTNYILPTHSHQSFITYKDDRGYTFSEGTTVRYLHYSFHTELPYELRDYDVQMKDGSIDKYQPYNYWTVMTIPETLEGQTVEGIANSIFKEQNIIEVLLPSNLKEIGDSAFYKNKINSLSMPTGVTKIGDYAFYMNQIPSVNIPGGVKRIGTASFCLNNLTSIDVPNGVEVIGCHAFEGNDIISLNLPESLVTIEYKAFRGNDITSLFLPTSLKEIGYEAFYSNKILMLNIGANSRLSHIGKNAFTSNSISSIKLPTMYNDNMIWDLNGLSYSEGESLVDFATAYFTDAYYTLTDDDVTVIDGVITAYHPRHLFKCIDIPEMLDGQVVSQIGASVFKNKEIRRLRLPSSIEVINENAFSHNLLSSITIPSNIKVIKSYAFGMNDFGSVTFEDNSKISFIEENAFFGNGSYLSISLPSHFNPNFLEYESEEGTVYQPGQSIRDFSLYYKVNRFNVVAFYDWDGTYLSHTGVVHGDNAVANVLPSRDGYTFTGWNKSLENITHDLMVKAQYSLATNIDDFAIDEALVYPNPAFNELHIKWDNSNSNVGDVQIYTISGQLVKTLPNYNNSGTIIVGELKPGSYILKVIVGDKVYTSTFLKK
jgi:hypothetical protein